MFAFIILLVLAVVGADSTAAAPSITAGGATKSTADRRASSDSAAPALDPSSRRKNTTTTTDEKLLDIDDNVADVLNEDGCFTILSIIVKHLPALERNLAELNDVILPQKLPYPSVMVEEMLKMIRELVNYMNFIRQSVDDHVKGNPSTDHDRRRRIVTNEALHRISQATTLIKNTMGQTRLTADATAMEAMQTILSSMLSLNEYLLAVDVHEQNHHHSGPNSTTLEEEMMMDEEGSGSEDYWLLPDAEEEKALDRFHRVNPTNKFTAFLNAIGNPRAHTQAECCFNDCSFNDCCLDCCKCCPECSYPPAGDEPPVIPPAA